ncbi:hypothetical protein niasHT_005902 [Heterodera trifolii]|uniref:Uncharacterized protein n=1 Tax=Heterodera trifolii TaxID=157864 RepID=A0ABD2LX53_9BILA
MTLVSACISLFDSPHKISATASFFFVQHLRERLPYIGPNSHDKSRPQNFVLDTNAIDLGLNRSSLYVTFTFVFQAQRHMPMLFRVLGLGISNPIFCLILLKFSSVGRCQSGMEISEQSSPNLLNGPNGVPTFRQLDISPTDISPTDISPTDISPTDISPTKPNSDVSPTHQKSDISPTKPNRTFRQLSQIRTFCQLTFRQLN